MFRIVIFIIICGLSLQTDQDLKKIIFESYKAVTKFTNKSSIIQEVTSEGGFDKFDLSANFVSRDGIPDTFLKRYLDMQFSLLKMPKNNLDDLTQKTQTDLFENKEWNTFSYLYSPESDPSSTKYVNILAKHENGRSSWKVTDIQATFKLSPKKKICVIRKQYLFDDNELFTEDQIIEKNEETDISQSELDDLFNYFQTMAIKQIAEHELSPEEYNELYGDHR